MAIYNPHLPSHKLCRILDAGLATVEDIARLSGESVEFIELVARNSGVRLTVEQKFNLGKALSAYFRRHPELYREKKPESKRGVFEITPEKRGERTFRVTSRTGEWLGDYHWPAKRVTQGRLNWLCRQLDLEDPLPQPQPELKAI